MSCSIFDYQRRLKDLTFNHSLLGFALDCIICLGGGVGDRHGRTISELLHLVGAANISHELIVLHLLMMKPLGQCVHRALPLCLLQLGMLLHQEDTCARFLYKFSYMLFT